MPKTKNPFTLLGIGLLALSVILSIGLLLLIVTESLPDDGAAAEETLVIDQSIAEVKATKSFTEKKLSVFDEDRQISFEAKASTVGEVLFEAGIPIFFADRLSPPLGEWIYDGDLITIDRANQYTISVEGKHLKIYSHYTKTLDVLTDAGIGLFGLDTVRPGPNEILISGDAVEVVRVTEEVIVEEEPILYEVLWQGTDELELDQESQLNPGAAGTKLREIRVRLENGVESDRETNEWVSQEPVNEVMGYGTRIEIRSIDSPDGPVEYWRVVRMRVTAYTASSAGKPPDHPGYGITASGVQAGKGVVAIDPKIVPFRSSVYVPGYGIGFAGDTGGGVKGRWIDLGYNDGEIESWRGYVDVYYLTPVPSPDKINYLIPETLP